jgi:hypothetical protein
MLFPMTAQISDSVHFEEQDYAITGVSGDGLFSPQAHGLEPQMMSTACWRGFVCWYRVENDQLQLQNLWIRLEHTVENKSEKDPALFGIRPKFEEREWCANYENLHVPIAFTGGLLIGRDFIRELYVHMGFHPAWKFREVY